MTLSTIQRLLTFLPVDAQRFLLRAWRAALRLWRRLGERTGRSRHSRPALFDMDRKLQAYLPDGGFFIEAGAYDGFRQSTTYYLEKFRGWSGLLVEPIPELARAASKERSVPVINAALVSKDFPDGTIIMRNGGSTSSVTSLVSIHPSSASGAKRSPSLPQLSVPFSTHLMYLRSTF